MRMYKEMSNLEIAQLLKAISAAYEIDDETKNKFRISAYDEASTAIEHLSSEVKDLWDDGKLEDIPGVGPSIAQYLSDIFSKGKSEHFGKILDRIPPSVFEFMKVSGIGPKTAIKLAEKLDIKSEKNAIVNLKQAVKDGKVSNIEGFGKKSEEEIEKSISEAQNKKIRLLLPYAQKIADEISVWLRQDNKILIVEPLGSIRRKASTIGDIDIAVCSNYPYNAIERFVSYPQTKRILEKGKTTASIILKNGLQVDMMVNKDQIFGSILQHFTGSKQHNIALREYALKKGMSLSEYGIKKLNNKKNTVKTFKDEIGFYDYLGLNYIPPELREDSGEIEAAGENKIPDLIELKDIKGDLQIHSDFDIETSHDVGDDSMETIVKKASDIGYEYLAFTEHNPSKSKHNNDEIIRLIERKTRHIEHINSSLKKQSQNRVKKLFNSLEIDILPDGSLPIDDTAMDMLDFALVSIHSSFKSSKEDQTKRVLCALQHPKVKIFAHPTARILNKREGIDLDWKKVFEYCVKNKKLIEINADPARLDLPDFLIKEAKNYGVLFSMGTDSHNVESLKNMKWGVAVARRGWLTKMDVVNCMDYNAFSGLIFNV